MRRCVGSDRSRSRLLFIRWPASKRRHPHTFCSSVYAARIRVTRRLRSVRVMHHRHAPPRPRPPVLLRRRPITCELFASPLLSPPSPHGLASSTLLCPFSLATFILSLAPAARKTREVYYWRGVGRH